jgi:hypothetical protein
VQRQHEAAVQRARRAQQAAAAIRFDEPADLYDTRQSGADRQEVKLLVTGVLRNPSVAYHLRSRRPGENPFYQDEETRKLLLRTFDRLDERGFRPKDRADAPPAVAAATPVTLTLRGSWQVPELTGEVTVRAAVPSDHPLVPSRIYFTVWHIDVQSHEW